MPRELLSRAPRFDYAALFQYEADENEAGPSNRPNVVEDNAESGSGDFVPEEAGNGDRDDAKAEREVDDVEQSDVEDEEASAKIKRKKAKAKASPSKHKSKPRPTESRSSISLTPGLARPSNRQNYSLPQPHVHHRHRAIPLYRREANVERLKNAPILFVPGEASPTPSFTSSSRVTMRLGRAWGANVGPGPLWELLEDRAWYKEAMIEGNEAEEEKRRPRVYQDIHLGDNSNVIADTEALQYLPTDSAATESGSLKSPPSLICSFGPFDNQTRVKLQIFETFKISSVIPERVSYVFNAGAPVWGIDWCPIHPKDRLHLLQKQFLAVSVFPSGSYSPSIGVKVPRPFYSCIQIWSLAATSDGPDRGEMKCDMVLCIDSGPAHVLKWCPLPSNDSMHEAGVGTSVRKLGLLAGTFEDGSLTVYAVPYPPDIALSSKPIFVKLEPIIRIELEDTCCWSFDWGNSEVLAIGCTNGSIAVYDVSQAVRNGSRSNDQLLPLHYISAHQSAIRSIAWIRVPPTSSSGTLLVNEDPTVIASGGYDGVEGFTDFREPSTTVFNRTRDVINDMTYSPFGAGVATIDHENIVKVYSASPSMLGRGHSLLESRGPVWSLGSSDYHPHIAIGSVDGTCMTTNALRSTRKGGIPLFSYKIYQLDYSRDKKEWRMLERFFPQETQDRPSATRAKSKNPNVQVNPIGTGAWSPEVGVHRVVWNNGNGLSNAHLLASATGSGLCRIDWLTGRWIKDKVPYYDVEKIRGDIEAELDMDEEEEESD